MTKITKRQREVLELLRESASPIYYSPWVGEAVGAYYIAVGPDKERHYLNRRVVRALYDGGMACVIGITPAGRKALEATK